MKKWMIAVLAVMAAAAAVADQPAKTDAPQMAMGAPAEMKQLALLVGTWDVAAQIKAGPNAPWANSNATCTFASILDGAGLEQVYQGEYQGVQFKGTGIICYNRGTQKWQASWIDNMGAMLSLYEGDYADGKLVCSGEDHVGGITMQTRVTMSNISDKRLDYLLESSMDGGKTWMEYMKAVYTKK